MCRFLLVKSKKPIKPKELLDKFSVMAKNSKTFDGDWQGDGWGISWLDENNNWQCQLSLNPVWEDRLEFGKIPKTRIFLVHARSASFDKDKGEISYNQPYFNDQYSFVFNGLLQGVALPYSLEGKIGAQKIWSLVKRNLLKNSASSSLTNTKDLLLKHTRRIQALNLGLSDKENIYGICFYSQDPNYYSLRYFDSEDIKIICSEELEGFGMKRLTKGEIKVL